LVHTDDSLVQLLDPPFNTSSENPGYIMGYPPGVRENGGQYTHAAVWLAQAYARLGRGKDAVRILQMLNPAERTSTAERLAQYRGEPYAVAADVSFTPGRVGIAGWTWYTGSAGWMYRVWLEDVLGFRLEGSRLRMAPNVPDDWPGFELTYRHGSSAYRIVVVRDSAGNAVTMQCDGKMCMENYVDLIDDGAPHRVDIDISAEKLVPVTDSRAN
jgi:cyclic beta-1,2-glucan synthetase